MLHIRGIMPKAARALCFGLRCSQTSTKVTGMPLLQTGSDTGVCGTGYHRPEQVWKMSADNEFRRKSSQDYFPELGGYLEYQRASEYRCMGSNKGENYSLLSSVTEEGAMDDRVGQDDHLPVFKGMNGHVSLYGCMQSNVPCPLNPSGPVCGYNYSTYLNMPGSGVRLLDKYLSGTKHHYHQSRHISVSAKCNNSAQGAQDSYYEEEDIIAYPSPEGIQGDNCVHFKLWMENCQRYNLPNCDEQLQSIEAGRKTLFDVFFEQQEIIRKVAEDYKKHQTNSMNGLFNAQGLQDSSYNFEFIETDPCPQGLQGNDCANFKTWMRNCQAHRFEDCENKSGRTHSGHRTFQNIFHKQDEHILKFVHDYQHRRKYSTDNKGSNNSSKIGISNKSNNSLSQTVFANSGSVKISQKDKLKRSVKEYGGTVIVFHIGISLISLGGFYVAVSSGLDVFGILSKLGVGESILQSKIATESTTFVVAYAVHKIFAPARIAVTLSCTPFIVKHLRKIGFLKPSKASSK